MILRGSSRALLVLVTLSGVLLGSSQGDTTLRWPIVRGTHAIDVRDDTGRTATARVIVR